MLNKNLFCVYLTTYKGNKLPPFYIGSTTIKRLHNYFGSVNSKEYRDIWKSEIKHNRHLFKLQVIKTFPCRASALIYEQKLHIKLDVVKNSMYLNKSIASPDGCFGVSLKGKLHPLYGKPRTLECKHKISINHIDVTGKNNPRALKICLVTPENIIIHCHGDLRIQCAKLNISYAQILKMLKHDIIPKRGSCIGYSVYYV